MINGIEEFPGQIKQLEGYIKILETEQYTMLQENRQLKERVADLEAQVYGGSTK